jgi:N6-L-threonylcarbamoyladenine synthase
VADCTQQLKSIFVQHTRILAIETSCDETAAAVIDDGRFIRSNVISSQIELHKQYGGVFPEMASRAHVEAIYPVIKQAMRDAGAEWGSLTAIAATRGPGLPGSLVVGVNAAKGMCLQTSLPLIGVNHLEGHVYSHWLSSEGREVSARPYTFPVIVLIVSGGHTELLLMRDHGQYELIGHTVDDAAGEAFDKVARMLGLGYPGGPEISRAATGGNAERFAFSRPRIQGTRGRRTDAYDGEFDFSFSGAKTVALRLIKDFGGNLEDGRPHANVPVADIAASFQHACVAWLVESTVQAVRKFRANAVLVGGGVSANRLLRQQMEAAFPALPVSFPPMALCTDNAAMIGAAAHFMLERGITHDLDMDVEPDLKIGM